MHDESSTRRKVDDEVHDGAIPAYLLDRDTTTRARVINPVILDNLSSDEHVIKCMQYGFQLRSLLSF